MCFLFWGTGGRCRTRENQQAKRRKHVTSKLQICNLQYLTAPPQRTRVFMGTLISKTSWYAQTSKTPSWKGQPKLRVARVLIEIWKSLPGWHVNFASNLISPAFAPETCSLNSDKHFLCGDFNSSSLSDIQTLETHAMNLWSQDPECMLGTCIESRTSAHKTRTTNLKARPTDPGPLISRPLPPTRPTNPGPLISAH